MLLIVGDKVSNMQISPTEKAVSLCKKNQVPPLISSIFHVFIALNK